MKKDTASKIKNASLGIGRFLNQERSLPFGFKKKAKKDKYWEYPPADELLRIVDWSKPVRTKIDNRFWDIVGVILCAIFSPIIASFYVLYVLRVPILVLGGVAFLLAMIAFAVRFEILYGVGCFVGAAICFIVICGLFRVRNGE